MSQESTAPAQKPPPGTRIPNARDRELLAMPAMDGRVPIRFDNGFSIDTFGVICNFCETTMPLESTYGSIINPTPGMVVIEAIGVCRSCRRGTPFLLRMKDDGQYTTLIGGVWRAGAMEPTWVTRFKRWWRSVLRGA